MKFFRLSKGQFSFLLVLLIKSLKEAKDKVLTFFVTECYIALKNKKCRNVNLEIAT